MNLEKIIDDVLDELMKATDKFPTWPSDPIHAKTVLDEEVGELEKAILQVVYEPEKSTKADVRKEAIQVAAMSLRFLLSEHEYEYRPSKQHVQKISYPGL